MSGPIRTWCEVVNRELNERYDSAVEEFNTRARQARYPLHYHNGFIQITNDELLNSEIEQPFWDVVSDPIWKNVDTDMKEALDRRDTDQRDPAFYAARALESTIKIISDEKGWTHGGETGAHNYLDNLGSVKNGNFIERWEKQVLKDFFTNVRKPICTCTRWRRHARTDASPDGLGHRNMYGVDQSLDPTHITPRSLHGSVAPNSPRCVRRLCCGCWRQQSRSKTRHRTGAWRRACTSN